MIALEELPRRRTDLSHTRLPLFLPSAAILWHRILDPSRDASLPFPSPPNLPGYDVSKCSISPAQPFPIARSRTEFNHPGRQRFHPRRALRREIVIMTTSRTSRSLDHAPMGLALLLWELLAEMLRVVTRYLPICNISLWESPISHGHNFPL
jgi:hypothetical protein